MLQSLHQTIQVTYHYSVHFTHKLFAQGNLLLKETITSDNESARSLLCVIDDGVVAHHAALMGEIEAYCRTHQLRLVCAPLVIPGGEQAKTESTNVALLQEVIHRSGLCRHSYVLAIGGGAVLDMVGYAAAMAHRGVRLLRVPTTVLAQND